MCVPVQCMYVCVLVCVPVVLQFMEVYYVWGNFFSCNLKCTPVSTKYVCVYVHFNIGVFVCTCVL